MTIRFRVHYYTPWGQTVHVVGNSPALGDWSTDQSVALQYLADGFWEISVELPEGSTDISYKYFIRHEYGGGVEWEFGDDRHLQLQDAKVEEVVLKDEWRGKRDPENALFSSAFTDTLLHREAESAPAKRRKKEFLHRFRVYAPRVAPDQVVTAVGSDAALGNWDPAKGLQLSAGNYPLWEGEVVLEDPDAPLEFKYVIQDPRQPQTQIWEYGSNRYLAPEYTHVKSRLVVTTQSRFNHPHGQWRGTGVALPVFSLRSKQSTGVGEFLDLKLLVDWSRQTELAMVQILPINDTIATHTWQDSYPYAAISVFALHPMYANLEAMGIVDDAGFMAEVRTERQRLNDLPEIDLVAVMALKSRYFKRIFDQDWAQTKASADFQAFFEENKGWLQPYAVFCSLRDKFGTVKFGEWPEYSQYDEAAIAAYADPAQPHYENVAIHYFIQYHLDRQLMEARDYARRHRVALKGDIPIGIYRHSVDAWVNPHLYNMDGQAGAPPDAFAVAGQNWGFPTYDWQEMAQNGFQWWQRRLQQLSKYFDAFRIDHILGFFRIWEIPYEQVQGIMGQFNPALPFHRDELMARGLWLDDDRLARPYIREHLLGDFFGEHTEAVKREFLNERWDEPGRYDLKPEFATQRQVYDYLESQMLQWPESRPFYEAIREGLYSLIANVVLLPYPGTEGQAFCPRIAMHFTKSYQELDHGRQRVLDELYLDFFYRRHEQFWRDQALVKLPAIKAATNMLVCGEDLGMVPECVPGVMDELGILSLEIQRMPKASSKEFDHPGEAPYLSVVSTSTHDMPTIRGWWEEDPELTQRFYQQILGHGDSAPYFCEDWVAREIVVQHLYSPAMWAVFPIQDLLAMDNSLRRDNPHDEQINDPSNPQHYWRYRLHLDLEDLLAADTFNRSLSGMVIASGRGREGVK